MSLKRFISLQGPLVGGRFSSPYLPKLGDGNKYHVAKSGNDNSAGSASFPFLTIDKAAHVVQPGDTVYIHAGSYTELSSFSQCAVTCYTAGLVNNPITFMAWPGDEGTTYIDGGGTRMGVQTNNLSNLQFWGLRVRNGKTYGFNNWGQVGVEVPADNILSKNVLIENCHVHDIQGDWGVNISGIGPWGTKNWIVRNTKIRNVSALPPSGGQNPTVTSGIQWYQAINLLIENVDTDTQYGFSAKDHFLDAVTPTRIPSMGMTARFNKIKASHAGVRCSIRGGNTPEAGDQLVHNNLIFGLQNANAEGGIVGYMDGGTGQSKRLGIYNNTIDMTSAPNAPVLEAQLFDAIEYLGNVAIGSNLNLSIAYGHAVDYKTLLTICDYNVYTAAQWILDRYSTNPNTAATYSTLNAWKALMAGDKASLGVNNPDQHSLVKASTDFFTDLAGGDYHPKAGGDLIGFLPDGFNAGCYQTGTETIGLLPRYSAG